MRLESLAPVRCAFVPDCAQLPEFAAYLNILIKQAADETLLQAACLLTTALRIIKQRLESSFTTPDEQARLALRLLSLYSNPAFLKFLSTREDDPNDLTRAQMLAEHRASKVDDPSFDPSDRQLFLRTKQDLLTQAQSFDTKYPDAGRAPTPKTRIYPRARSLAEICAEADAKRAATKMEQNGTPAQRSTALAPALVLPPIQPPQRTKLEQNGTSTRRSMALGAAISGVLPQIAAIR